MTEEDSKMAERENTTKDNCLGYVVHWMVKRQTPMIKFEKVIDGRRYRARVKIERVRERA